MEDENTKVKVMIDFIVDQLYYGYEIVDIEIEHKNLWEDIKLLEIVKNILKKEGKTLTYNKETLKLTIR